jgi:hypothetical protein
VRQSLRDTVKETFGSDLVPGFERASQAMLGQLLAAVDRALPAAVDAPMRALSQQLRGSMDELAAASRALADSAARAQQHPPPPAPFSHAPPPPPHHPPPPPPHAHHPMMPHVPHHPPPPQPPQQQQPHPQQAPPPWFQALAQQQQPQPQPPQQASVASLSGSMPMSPAALSAPPSPAVSVRSMVQPLSSAMLLSWCLILNRLWY